MRERERSAGKNRKKKRKDRKKIEWKEKGKERREGRKEEERGIVRHGQPTDWPATPDRRRPGGRRPGHKEEVEEGESSGASLVEKEDFGVDEMLFQKARNC